MLNLADPSMALLAASGGDTVKLLDVSQEEGPYSLTYAPSPGCVVNYVKWNHASESTRSVTPLFGRGRCGRRLEDLVVEEEWTECGDHSGCGYG